MKRLTGFERWKAGKKVRKAPWVIQHYESITDVNQYKLGKIVEERFVLIAGIYAFCTGFFIACALFGW